MLVAVQPQVPPGTLGRLENLHLQERLLESGGGRGGGREGEGEEKEKEVVIRERRKQQGNGRRKADSFRTAMVNKLHKTSKALK